MTERRNRAGKSPWLNRAGAGLAASALVMGAGFAAAPAFAAEGGESTVSNATFSWRVNDESGGGAFYGGCNFLVAGKVGDLGSARVWGEAEAAQHYRTTDGNVTITKPDSDGKQIAPTWDTKCQDAAGQTVKTWRGSTSGNQMNFANGTGKVDAAGDNASIDFPGAFTIVFYGGMTYWSVSNLHLEVTGGVGKITGTASGYGTDMHDLEKWVPLEDTPIDVATFKGVDVTETGIEITPDYRGVEVNTEGGMSDQKREGENWGAFPQSWVDFNIRTGQSSYWYSAGGVVDPKKVAVPLSIGYTVDAAEPPATAPEGNVDVTIPEATTKPTDPTDPEVPPTEPKGKFGWAWEGGEPGGADLATATQDGDNFVAQGNLDSIIVTDDRTGGENQYSWSLSGQVSSFDSGKNKFSGSYLGWEPSVTAESDAVKPGNKVNPGAGETEGLAKSQLLATSGAAAPAKVNALLNLMVPVEKAPAGKYTAQLTISAIS